jgi:hypothetical protein
MKLSRPSQGEKITHSAGRLKVPDRPVIPFIEGDGTGPDIWKASQRVFDAAVEKAYGGKRKIEWFEIYAGEKAQQVGRLSGQSPSSRHLRVHQRIFSGDQRASHHSLGKGFDHERDPAPRVDLYVCLSRCAIIAALLSSEAARAPIW